MTTKPKILFLVKASLEISKKKGVEHLIYERDEFGFFSHVYSISFPVEKTKITHLNNRHTILEFGFDKYNFLKRIELTPIQKIFVTLRTLVFLKKLIKKEKINLIRATDPFLNGFFAYLLAKMTKIPFCISIHADYNLCSRLNSQSGRHKDFRTGKIGKFLASFCLRKAKLVMPISHFLADNYLKNFNLPKHKIVVIHHGINVEEAEKEFNLSERVFNKFKLRELRNKKIVSFAGRFSREKFIYDIVEVARLMANINNVVFILAGDGPEKSTIERIIKENNLTNIRLLGFIPKEKVLTLFKVSTIILSPLAGFGLIEACLSGKPVICYDVEWHKEVIKDKETGFLIKEGDVKEVVRTTLYLLQNPDKAREIGGNAKSVICKRFNIKNTSATKVQAYKRLLSIS